MVQAGRAARRRRFSTAPPLRRGVGERRRQRAPTQRTGDGVDARHVGQLHVAAAARRAHSDAHRDNNKRDVPGVEQVARKLERGAKSCRAEALVPKLSGAGAAAPDERKMPSTQRLSPVRKYCAHACTTRGTTCAPLGSGRVAARPARQRTSCSRCASSSSATPNTRTLPGKHCRPMSSYHRRRSTALAVVSAYATVRAGV